MAFGMRGMYVYIFIIFIGGLVFVRSIPLHLHFEYKSNEHTL
jgi:hypothetical protein